MTIWWHRYTFEDETNGDGGAGGGAAAETIAGATGDDTLAGGAGDDTQGGAAAGEAPADMLAAISQGLGYEKKEGDAGETPEAKAEREKKAADELAAKDLEAKAAAGDPEALRQKAEAERKAKAEAAKPRDLKALELTPEQRKAMKAETAARYNEVLGIAKTERAGREKAESQVQALSASRDAIVGVLRETHTSDTDLARLLEFNRLTKTGRPEDLETALSVVSQQRLLLLKALGREGDGHDPLKDYPDLAKEVEDLKITKERALEIAAARRRDALNKNNEARQRQAQSAQQQTAAQQKKAEDDAMQSIEAWCDEMKGTDLDFKAKESKVLPEVAGIIRDYPPSLWLKTFKRLYDAAVVTKGSAAPGGGEPKPLRPGGPKPGGAAPTSMLEAINQGLGYAEK